MIYPFFHKHNDPSYLHFGEFENLPKNILHVGYILNGDNDLSNEKFIELLQYNIKSRQIDLVILDCTGEPWDVYFEYRVGLSPVTAKNIV